ncbi:ankyrin repeat domain-containing protein 27-like [Bolinopsis microptera]|uniref:ankyrin repeat domain-containing protein 27-like n=1 Tax=Bolinopsis microptera TaxID=2820187 RepID=UPI003078C045
MSLYDENLVDNPFFQEVLRHEDFLNEIIANKLTLCVPCIGSFNKKHQLTLEDVETHTISRDEEVEGMFRTYNNRTLSTETKGFKTLDNFDEEKVVKVLFEETFFLDESRYINVICVDSRFDCASLTGYTDIKCDTLQQCTQFLFDENTPWARAQLDDILQKCVVSHKSAGMCLKELVTNTKRSFQRCLDIVEKDFHFSRKVLTNPNFQMFLELSVEFYVMTYLHQTIFAELCYIFGAKDAAVNKTLRNLSQVKPGEIEDLNSVFFTSLPLSQAKMAQLNCEQSPREKVRLLCDCLTCLPNASSTGQAMSMDDLLPLLNYLIIKSEVPNWLANLCYMQHFTFAQYSPDDRHGFTLVCFEASLEHIRNGSLNYLIAPANQGSVEAISLYDTTFSPIQILQNCVLLNRCDDLALILGLVSTPVRGTAKPLPTSTNSRVTMVTSSNDVKRCHPLCSCDVCEKSILNLRWKDITVGTPFNSSGVSILHIAAQNNYTNMLELLLEQGADVNIVDSAGRSALHLACHRSICASSVLLLIAHKANANTGDNLGRTPLHEVCERGHTDILQSMIYQKINLRVNAEAHNGDTPLHLAARYGYGDIVSLLLDVGASMSIRNNKGETPLSSAHSKYISHILQLFSSELELEQIKKRSVTCNLNEEQEKLFRLCAEGDLQMIKHKLNLRAFRTSSMTRPRLQSIKTKCHPLCQCEECFEAVEQSPVSRTCSATRIIIHFSTLQRCTVTLTWLCSLRDILTGCWMQ